MSSDEKERTARDQKNDDDKEEDSATSSKNSSDRPKKKHHKKHSKKKKKRKNRSDDDSDDASRRHRKRRRKHESSDDDSRSYDSSSEESRRRRRRRRKKKDKKKKKKKHKKYRKQEEDSNDSGPPAFGKYGIIKQSDYHKMQRSFEVWMAEVKGVPSFTGSKRELQNYFAEYAEDYNTATLPHKKYYNYDKWEMEEYQKKRQGRSSVKADEARLEQERLERAQQKQQAEMDLVKQTMSHEKVLEMKRQQELRSQMQIAYKMGDMETYERLKERLGPET